MDANAVFDFDLAFLNSELDSGIPSATLLNTDLASPVIYASVGDGERGMASNTGPMVHYLPLHTLYKQLMVLALILMFEMEHFELVLQSGRP
jgi:hypothetical protein